MRLQDQQHHRYVSLRTKKRASRSSPEIIAKGGGFAIKQPFWWLLYGLCGFCLSILTGGKEKLNSVHLCFLGNFSECSHVLGSSLRLFGCEVGNQFCVI